MRNYATAVRDHRGEPRDEVMHRTHAIDGDGRRMKLVLVNMSANGLMARCEGSPEAGDRLRITLPILGGVDAIVRWSLGGRIGCELEQTIPLSDYYGMLSVMVRNS
ncbi:MAG: pilus assembly protein PilZ [Sphingomonas taxi]|uniref:Pilus assembly protein PilZ n=1 Tax=Sphingomonas taxi TaxID=1549858 RepID=A0A2W4Z0X7_9SPHN|nr:MAG: pilus assembly protein PilZ [Sphingomonas taxi]